MIRYNDIIKALKPLVGWEQSLNPKYRLPKSLTDSESGLTIPQAHPLITIDNIASLLNDDPIDYPLWSATETYYYNQIVNVDGELWIAENENTNSFPQLDNLDWRQYEPLAEFLDKLRTNGIVAAVNTYLSTKQIKNETRSLLEHRTLFDNAGRINNVIQPHHKIVGFEIMPVRSMGVTMKINRVGLQMVGTSGNVKLYLFHSSRAEPVKIFSLNFTNTSGRFQWFDIEECYLPYVSSDNNAGGCWYLCYSQDELPYGLQAINTSKNWSKQPCGTCNRAAADQWRQLLQYVEISPFVVNSDTFNDEHQLWNIDEMIYTTSENFGLNCEFSIGCDISDFIITQRHLFARVVQLQTASIVLRTLALNPNVCVNRNQSNASRGDIMFELVGNTDGRETGLDAELKSAYKGLEIDTRNIDRICLSCKPNGIKYSTI